MTDTKGKFEEYIDLIFSLAGGSVDVAVSAIDRYLWVVGRVSKGSILVLLGVFALVFLSELTGLSALVALAVILVGAVVAVWSVLAFPMVMIVELGTQWEPVRRQLRTLGFVIVAAAAFAFLALRLPSGFGGVSILISLFVLFLGLAAFGFRPTRTTLGIQMILTALFSIVAVAFPQTSGLLGSVAGALDTEVSRRFSPTPTELDMSMSVLTGQGENSPALFKLHDGSPNWWCRADTISEAGFRCFGQPGRDQTTQTELIPITPGLVQVAITNLEAAEATRNAEAERLELERLAEEAERERLEAERRAAEEAEQQRQEALAAEEAQKRRAEETRRLAEEAERARLAYIEKYVTQNTNSTGPSWSFMGGNPSELDRILDGFLPSYQSFLHMAATTDGVFERLSSGNQEEIERLGLFELTPIIVLGRISERSEDIGALQGGQKSIRTLNISVVDTEKNAVVLSQTLRVEALGQNLRIAQERSLDELKSRLEEFIERHITTLKL